MKLAISILTLVLLAPFGARATVFMTQQQALDSAFPRGTAVERQTKFLTGQQVAQVRNAGAETSELVVRYIGRQNGQVVGYVYFDAHRVRTLPETIMLVVTPAGVISRVEILSFKEPQDYLPKRRWLDQLHGRRLDAELSLRRAIRPISGASLSGRAIVDASRKVLAIHGALENRASTPSTPTARR